VNTATTVKSLVIEVFRKGTSVTNKEVIFVLKKGMREKKKPRKTRGREPQPKLNFKKGTYPSGKKKHAFANQRGSRKRVKLTKWNLKIIRQSERKMCLCGNNGGAGKKKLQDIAWGDIQQGKGGFVRGRSLSERVPVVFVRFRKRLTGRYAEGNSTPPKIQGQSGGGINRKLGDSRVIRIQRGMHRRRSTERE